jgi:hypothetical protein
LEALGNHPTAQKNLEFFPFWPPEGDHPRFDGGVEPSLEQAGLGEPQVEGIAQGGNPEIDYAEDPERQNGQSPEWTPENPPLFPPPICKDHMSNDTIPAQYPWVRVTTLISTGFDSL